MLRKLILSIYVLFTALPLAAALGYSLLYSFGLTGLMNKGFTLKYWGLLFTQSDGMQSLGYTVLLTLASMVLILLPTLYFTWKQTFGRGSSVLYKTLFLPLTFPPLVVAFIIYHLLSPAGFISRFLYGLGLVSDLESFPRLVNDYLSIGILVAHVYLIFPLFTLLAVHIAKKERMVELHAIAQNLGSSSRQFAQQVFRPVLLRKLSPMILLYSIFLMGTYEVPLLLGRSSPRTVTLFITEKLMRFNLLEIPVGHAMAVVYSLLIILVAWVFLRRNKAMLLVS